MTQNNSEDTVEVKREYYESGILWFETPYVNGKEHGVRKEYCYKTGALRRETPYVNGEKHGVERDYDKEGTEIYYLTLYDKDQEVTFVKI